MLRIDSSDQSTVIGRAIISTSFSKHWEATIELMQADTKNRFANMQIFAMLLSCIRKICVERFIWHLAMVDLEGVSQGWYGDFFRLAGFSPCRCQISAGSELRVEPRNCLALMRESLDRGFSAVYERIEAWLAEGRCTRSLLDSVASGQAAEVEQRYFHDLLAEIGDERSSQSVRMGAKSTVRDTFRTRRPRLKSMQKLPATKTKAQQHQIGAVVLTKQWPSRETIEKGMAASAYKVGRKRKQSWKAKRKRAVGVRQKHKLGDIGVGDRTRDWGAGFVL